MFSLTKKSHFTFMECIAVMVIIIVLITILLPTAVKIREICNNMVCKSNMKAIYNGVMSYCNDWKGVLPYPNGNIPGCGWATKLPNGDYLPAPQVKYSSYSRRYYPTNYKTIYTCPSQPLDWKNQYLSNACGYSANASAFYWEISHYSVSNAYTSAYLNYNILHVPKTYQKSKVTLVRDCKGGGVPNWAPCADPFNRHMGTPANYTGSNQNDYTVFHGTALMNAIMLDGTAVSMQSTDKAKYNW